MSPQRRGVQLGLHAGVVAVKTAARREPDRELGRELVDGWLELHHAERRRTPPPVRILLPQPGVQELRAGMALVGARPLDTAHRLHALVAHAPVHRRQAPPLVPGIPGRNVTPVASETPGELRDDPDVVPGITRRLERPANP